MEKPVDLYRLGYDLKAFRASLKLPQKSLSNIFGMSISYLSSIERGYEPSLETAYRVRKVLKERYDFDLLELYFNKSLFIKDTELANDGVPLRKAALDKLHQNIMGLETNTLEIILKLIESDISKLGVVK